jgi:hypothetical protein
MMYKVPCPTNTNGVRLFKEGNQVLVEYQKGNEPHVGGMAFDSALGTMARTVTIRPKRPDFDRIIAAAKRKVLAQDMLPRASVPPIRDALPNVGNGPHSPGVAFNFKSLAGGDDMEPDNSDAEEIVGNLMDFLADKLSPDDLEGVKLILSSVDPPDADTGAPTRQATDRRAVDAQRRRLAADRGRHGISEATERETLEMFPNWNRLSS